MNDKRSDNSEEGKVDVSVGEMHELKRDMQSAKIEAWLHENQKNLIAGVVAVFLVATGSALWQERVQAQQASAAMLYQQALAADDDEMKSQLLGKLIDSYGDGSYAVMARVQLAAQGGEDADRYLQQLIDDSNASMEFRWQARIDLAERHLHRGEHEKVRAVLHERTGTQYEQLRYYLLAEASEERAEKADYYRKALDAVSHDDTLKQRIEQRLALVDIES